MLAVIWVVLVALVVAAILMDDLPDRRRVFRPPADDLNWRREPREQTQELAPRRAPVILAGPCARPAADPPCPTPGMPPPRPGAAPSTSGGSSADGAVARPVGSPPSL